MLAANRLRVRKACINCKRRKVKCDGLRPCQNCIKHNMHCSYQPDLPRIRNTTFTSISSDPIHEADLRWSSPWQRYSPHNYRFQRRHQNSLPYYLGLALMKSLPQSVIDQCSLRPPRLQFYGWNMSGGHYLEHRHIQFSQDSAQWQWDFTDPIQRKIVEKLAGFYFQDINQFISIVHEQAFWQQFKNGFVNRDPHGSADLFESILNLIVAIALRFSYTRDNCDVQLPNSTTKASPSECLSLDEVQWVESHVNLEERLFEFAYTVTDKLSFEWESFELIQSWLLITFYLRTCHRQVSCSQALSRAVQICNGMSLFLNRFPEHHNAYDECRARNCYWTCFVMDRLINFQMGRVPGLVPPGPEMEAPDIAFDSWQSPESISLYKLAIIISDCQKPHGEELPQREYQSAKNRLIEWYDTVGTSLGDQNLCTGQVILMYLDVRIALEINGLFSFLDVEESCSPNARAIKAPMLLDLVSLVLNTVDSIVASKLYFRPWWLNLSLLFTSSIISLILIRSGIQLPRARLLLEQSFKTWHYIENTKPPNPPEMASECLWCLKMLNHMICQQLQLSARELESVMGVDHSNDSVNNNKFRQFGEVEKEPSKTESRSLEFSPPLPTLLEDNNGDLLAHLKWFDQWLDVNNLDTLL
ncbi:LAME_0G14532g1_1 [Lachancea meyersii CBS 8951]|uniref:LAME_0G14532g1_1 n=1 Tax=Lachancea meyersii CBS 8951 TaxID=1266667 RepID=A0A1G4KAF4_9SACH|nr:LAME_0G14532g1_1 [Lachancea meyersii CBS 8951]